MIVCWAYLERLVITAVSAVPFLWLDVFKFLCSELNFIVFFSHEKKSSNFRKFSQEMEYTRAKSTRYSGHIARAKGEHNSSLKLFITQTLFGGPMQFELSKFHCTQTLAVFRESLAVQCHFHSARVTG